MWPTVLIISAFLLALWVLLKFKEVRHRVFGAVLIILLLILFLSSSHVIKTQGIDLKSDGGLQKFIGAYGVWLSQAFGNVKEITGGAIDMNWKLNKTAVIDGKE